MLFILKKKEGRKEGRGEEGKESQREKERTMGVKERERKG